MHGSAGNMSPYPRHNVFFAFDSVENRLVASFCGPPPLPEFPAVHKPGRVAPCSLWHLGHSASRRPQASASERRQCPRRPSDAPCAEVTRVACCAPPRQARRGAAGTSPAKERADFANGPAPRLSEKDRPSVGPSYAFLGAPDSPARDGRRFATQWPQRARAVWPPSPPSPRWSPPRAHRSPSGT